MEQSDKEWANPEAAQKEAEQKAQQAAQAQTNNVPEQSQPVNPTQSAIALDLEKERKQANKYVIISLCCRYAPMLLSFVVAGAGLAINNSRSASDIREVISSLSSWLAGTGYFASWVLVIVARVMFKNAKSPKVLIIVYIVLLGLEILLCILLFMAFMAIIESCRGAA